jgi:hypothetical protein
MSVLMHSNPWDEPGAAGHDEIEWHMWSTRQWPYLRVDDGDEFFAVTGGGPALGTIKSECRIEHLVRAPYASHEEAWDLVRTGIPAPVRKEHQLTRSTQFLRHSYTVRAPESGHLMAFLSRHIRNENRPRPEGFKFRPNGWGEYDGPRW